MKLIKKLSVIILVVMLISVSCIQAYAVTSTQDGLKVTFTTNKDEYSKNEQIIATLTVENTSETAINNVSLKNIIPQGYKLADNSKTEKQVEMLSSGEIVTAVVTYIPNNEEIVNSENNTTDKNNTIATNPQSNNADKSNTDKNNVDNNNVSNTTVTQNADSGKGIATGDNISFAVMFTAVMLGSVVVIFLSVKKKKIKNVVSLLLCVTILGGVLPISGTNAFATEEQTIKEISVDLTVKCENKATDISAKVYYSANTSNTGNIYTVNFDLNYESAEAFPSITVQEGEYVTIPKEPTRDGYIFAGWYLDQQLTQYFIPENTPITSDITLYAWWINLEIDTDGDGVADDLEKFWNTDKNKADTDGDGLSDGIEINTLYTDPLKADTDDNGTDDGQEDFDSDGLTNLQECDLGTDPNNADSDNDRLTDYDEVSLYHTDPLKEDTDGDLMSDYTEIQVGLDPLKTDTDDDGVIDSEEIITINVDIDKDNLFDIDTALVVPSITIMGMGDYNKKLNATDISDNEAITDIPCIIGSPYEFVCNSDISFATCSLTFTLNDKVLEENSIVDLMIMWYDESNNTINPIKTYYNEENKQIYASINQFGVYAVINKKTYYSSFVNSLTISNSSNSRSTNNSNNYSTYNGNYYAVIDESMSWTEAMDYCASLGGHLVTIQDEEEQEFVTSLIKTNPKKNLYWIGLTGENNHYSWITGEPLDYENWNDGEPNNSTETAVHMYANVVAEQYAGLWNDTFNRYDGPDSYYSYKNCGIICEWENDPSNITPDNRCFVLLSNGIMELLDKDPALGDRTVDTDGDGICDLDELGSITSIKIFNSYVGFNGETTKTIPVWTFTSNPAKADSDGDGVKDKIDSDRLKCNNQIPSEFKTYINKGYVSMDLINYTDDGFCICNKSLADLLNSRDVYYMDYNGLTNTPVQNWFDDWYVYSVTSGDTTVYGLLKMREPENDYIIDSTGVSTADLDVASVSISFARFDISQLNNSLYDKNITQELQEAIDKVTNANKAKHNLYLKTYFEKTESYAPYLIAEVFINKIVDYYNCNQFLVPQSFIDLCDKNDYLYSLLNANIGTSPNDNREYLENKISRLYFAVREINNKAGYNVFDFSTRMIMLENINSLSLYEKQAILSIYTADISFNMFAAEVQFHAEALDHILSAIDSYYKRAVIADMAFGEENESGFFDSYYDPSHSLVKNQELIHGVK